MILVSICELLKASIVLGPFSKDLLFQCINLLCFFILEHLEPPYFLQHLIVIHYKAKTTL